MSKAPKLHRQRSGKVSYCWRTCPWAANDISERVPGGERAVHTTTSGKMSLDIKGGHDLVGFVCLDNNCPYYLGTATTVLTMTSRVQYVNQITGEYTVSGVETIIPLCSGVRFWEK